MLKSIHKMHVTIFHVDNTKGIFVTPYKQLTVTQAQLTLHSSLKDISTDARCISCAGCSIWNRKNPPFFSDHYLRNRSTLDIGVLGYIGILQHKEHSPEVWHIPPGTPCIYIYIVLILFIMHV